MLRYCHKVCKSMAINSKIRATLLASRAASKACKVRKVAVTPKYAPELADEGVSPFRLSPWFTNFGVKDIKFQLRLRFDDR